MSRVPPKKRRRLTPINEIEQVQESSSDSEAQPILEDQLSQRTSHWNLEQDYERRPRKQKHGKEKLRLPIKTAEGTLQQVAAPQVEDEDLESELENGSVEDPAEQDGAVVEEPKLPPREQIIQAKEELARLAGMINEDPEEHITSLRSLARITSSPNATVTRLGLVTQLSVYKDVIPGYRIRPLSEEDMKAKVSKDVKKLRNFEQTIVSSYRAYVKDLDRISRLKGRNDNEETAHLVNVAVSCAANLLASVPHFNFRGDLLKILVDKLKTHNPGKDFETSCSTLQELFANDEDGNVSLEAVTLLSKMIKAANYNVHPRILNLFLHLRLLADFTRKGSDKGVDKNDDQADIKGKKGKEKREFRTKKERKLMKERKAIENEMKEADAVVSHEQRDQTQAEMLKLVFGIYFRILKARTPHLMGPVLEGLAKYAHLINQDFFGDILEALKELIIDAEKESSPQDGLSPPPDQEPSDTSSPSRDFTRESLLCVITAFALLQGQDASAAASSLNLNLDFFTTHLYRLLHSISVDQTIEHTALPSLPTAKPDAVNHTHTSTLLLRSLTSALLPATSRPSPSLLAAFTHQLLLITPQLPERTAIAVLALVHAVAKKHGRARLAALWNTDECRGDGVFDPLAERPEGSNPFAGTVWAGEVLRWHYAPRVREGYAALEGLVGGALRGK